MADVPVFDGDIEKYAGDNPIRKLNQDQRAFIEEVAYYANKECRERKAAGGDWVLPSVCITQACLESGYGKARTVNIFGIKGSGTVAATKEYYGGYKDVNASFVSYKGIEADVHEYYDLICGTGKYKGFDIYKAARNNPDTMDAIIKIWRAGYATSPTYDVTAQDFLNEGDLAQFDFSFDYFEDGYTNGIETCSELRKMVLNFIDKLKDYEKEIKGYCDSNPQIKYKTIVDFGGLNNLLVTMKVLINRTEAIANNEKEIAEEYNKDDGSLDIFSAIDLALGTSKYSVVGDAIDMQDLIKSYKEEGSLGNFDTWFEAYVTKQGVESKVVDMDMYTQAIKDSGATYASNYVISKVGEITDSDIDEENKNTDKEIDYNVRAIDDTDDINDVSNDDGESPKTTGPGTGSGKKKQEKNKEENKNQPKEEKDKKEEKTEDNKEDNENTDDANNDNQKQDENEKTDDKKDDESEKIDDKVDEDNKDEMPDENINTDNSEDNTTKPQDNYQVDGSSSIVDNNDSNVDNSSIASDNSYTYNDSVVDDTSEEENNIINNLAEPEVSHDSSDSQSIANTSNEGQDSTTKNTQSIYKIPTPTEDNSEVKRNSNGKVIPILTGIATTAAVGAGGAYAMHKKNNDNLYEEDNDIEEDEESDIDDNDLNLETYYESKHEDEDIEGYQDDYETLPDEYK